MEYTLEEKYNLIKAAVLMQNSRNPISIAKDIMHKDYVNIHGPEHHFLDGAAFMAAYRNAGGRIDLEQGLSLLRERTIKMPGAMCGYWGICGSTASLGAVLSIIHDVSPLSDSPYYSDDMEYTSSVINHMAQIGGPRCCKRNAFLAISHAVKFVKNKYGVEMGLDAISCEFTDFNKQCIKSRCPFYNRLF